jgi:hypothetical protein
MKNIQTGANEFALEPFKTASGNTISYTNPNTSFYFRPQVQISSEEGLHAYRAINGEKNSFIRVLTEIVAGCIPLQM